jgi:peptidoglycan hydrolase CwlO-like protein
MLPWRAFLISIFLLSIYSTTLAADSSQNKNSLDEISAKKAEIEELTERIQNLKNQHSATAEEAELIASQIRRLEASIEKSRLELSRTQNLTREVRVEKTNNEHSIQAIQEELSVKRAQLRHLIRTLYEREQTSIITVFLSSGSFSDLLAEHSAIQEIQNQSISLVQALQAQEKELNQRQTDLSQQEQDLAQLQAMQAAQKVELQQQEAENRAFLQAKKEEQIKYEQKIAEAEQARQEIENDVFSLQGAGNVKVKLTEATDIAAYAGKLTGIRPALLLAVLKVESNVGKNIGSGTFPDDMQPASRDPFLRITSKLGLDPYTAPISARPAGGWGWGGAVGPAQIMPQTWEGIESRLAQLLNKTLPDPYDLTDAFVATAIFLADRGATDPSREYEAVNRYLAGPNWQRFTWYGDRVMAVAKEYESN